MPDRQAARASGHGKTTRALDGNPQPNRQCRLLNCNLRTGQRLQKGQAVFAGTIEINLRSGEAIASKRTTAQVIRLQKDR